MCLLGRLSDFWEQNSDGFSLSTPARQLIEASLRDSTERQYGSKWRKWLHYCSLQRISPTSPTVINVIEFLTELFETGHSHSSINGYRSAISSTVAIVDGFKLGQHPLVTRLMKGVFNKRPPQQKLFSSWSVKKVLLTLQKWSPSESLSLKLLTLKTIALLALSTGKRCSAVQ